MYINKKRFDESFSLTIEEITRTLSRSLSKYVNYGEKLVIGGKISREYANIIKRFHQFDYSFVVERGGKRIRPYILITVAEGNGFKDRDSLLPIGCAVETLHNATLEHDDITDKDDYRSDLPTVRKGWRDFLEDNKKFMKKGQRVEEKADFLTISNGDKLLILPYYFISQSKLKPYKIKNDCANILSKASVEISEGQILDLSFEGRTTTTLDDVLFMYEKKTGALFEACARMGMTISGGSKKQIELISKWARKYFNWSFSIEDDFIENNIDGKKGKPIGGDIKEGKVTPLFIEALQRSNKRQKRILLNAWGNRKAGLDEINAAINVMYETDTVDYLRYLKNEFVEKGKELLKKVGFEEEYEELLIDLTEFVGVRSS